MQPANYPPSQFPPTIDAVPAEGRLAETFAFTPGALAIGGLLGLIGSFIGIQQHGFRELEQLYLPGVCFLVAVFFGAGEIWRRMHRLEVVFWGNQIGVYRRGMLVQTAYRSQIQIYQLSILNTIRELMAFGMFALIGLALGIFSARSDLGLRLMFIGAAIGSCGAFTSSIYARIACRHFFIPDGKSTDQVMYTRGDASRFGI
jgi:hypothetical protein